MDAEPIPQLIKEGYTKRDTIGLSQPGEHTVKNQDQFFPLKGPSPYAMIQLVCDGVTTHNPAAIDKHTGLAWATKIANNLPRVFEEIIDTEQKTPSFTINNQSSPNLTQPYRNTILDLFEVNDVANIMKRYPDFFVGDQVGLIPYLTMHGYMTDYKILMGNNGYCFVPKSFIPDETRYYISVEENKVSIDEITTNGYVDYDKITQATERELLEDPEKYINYIFPPDKRSPATIALLQALEKVSSDFIQTFSEQYPEIPGATTVTGALETDDEVFIFTIGDSRTAVTIDRALIALTGKHGGFRGLTSAIGGIDSQTYTNQAENISILRIPKNVPPPDNLCNLGAIKEDDPFMVWLNETGQNDISTSAQTAINGATTNDDKTIVISELEIGGKKWRIISFSDGVFNPPPTQRLTNL